MTVEAAGAVLWRHADAGVAVALVHRPKYDDWSLPKGKLDPGEGLVEAAQREVGEETGHQARVGAYLGCITYPVRSADGRLIDKAVHYWAMEAVNGAFTPGREVDELRWLPPDEAAALLSYARDREVLDRFVTGGGPR